MDGCVERFSASIVNAFKNINWSKPNSLFENYLIEQQVGECIVWLAYVRSEFAGYITLKRHSLYSLFAEQNIPEIIDLNVLPQFRKLGIGSHLLKMAEIEAAKISDIVGISVGLYAGDDGGYGAAQRLYVQHGYVPNGKGVTYNYQPAIPGNSYELDDDLILWFTKNK